MHSKLLMALFKQIKFIKLTNAICYCNLILMLKTEKYIELFVEKVCVIPTILCIEKWGWNGRWKVGNKQWSKWVYSPSELTEFGTFWVWHHHLSFQLEVFVKSTVLSVTGS